MYVMYVMYVIYVMYVMYVKQTPTIRRFRRTLRSDALGKTCKTHHAWSTFGSWHVEKMNAAVARSTFRNQNEQNTPTSEHFWKLRCSKSAHRRGAKHISQSKCWKHHMLGPYLAKWAKREGFVAVSKHWQAWGAWRESAKMHVAWQVQCKRHMIQKC